LKINDLVNCEMENIRIVEKKNNCEWHGTATNERFGAMAGVAR